LRRRGAGFLEHEALARLGRTAARHEGLGEAGQVFQQRHLQAPLVGGDAAHAVAALGQFDGGLHQVAERQLAETLGQRRPAGHGAGGGDGVPAAQRQLVAVGVAVLLAEVAGVPGGRCHAGRIQAMHGLAVPQDGEAVAAQAVGDGLDDGERRGGRDGGVDALPPCCSMRRPACEARGCEVATTLRAKTGRRVLR
jgi:hypothetical protein